MKRAKCAVCVDLGGTKLSAAVIDNNYIIHDKIVTSSFFDKGISAVFENLINTVSGLIGKSGAKNISGVGIAASGRIDSSRGKIIAGVPLCEGYIGFELGKKSESKLGKPVIVENDANAAAYAEWAVGGGKKARRLVCITIGTGIGGGIVIDGNLISGYGNAGEIGHINVVKNGLCCGCGGRGCLEKYFSRKILQDEIMSLIKSGKISINTKDKNISTGEIISLIKSGNFTAINAFKNGISYLAIAIETLVNVIDPDLILLSGEISKLGKILTDEIKRQIRFDVKIAPAKLKNDAGLTGAGILALKKFR